MISLFLWMAAIKSRAYSEKAVKKNIQGSLKAVASLKPNFVFFQEVDTNGTRSHHIDEDDLLQKGLPDYSSTWTQNYDSPYLMYPLKSSAMERINQD